MGRKNDMGSRTHLIIHPSRPSAMLRRGRSLVVVVVAAVCVVVRPSVTVLAALILLSALPLVVFVLVVRSVTIDLGLLVHLPLHEQPQLRV